MEKVHLVVGSSTFSASAESLSAKSDYFKALLNSGMQETVTNKVILPEFDKKSMKVVLKFIEDSTITDFDVGDTEELMEVCVSNLPVWTSLNLQTHTHSFILLHYS